MLKGSAENVVSSTENKATHSLWRVLSVKTLLTYTLAVVIVWQLGGALTIHAKAWLAQRLIERAWQQTLEGVPGQAGELAANALPPQIKPWPWADTWPVARLQWDARSESEQGKTVEKTVGKKAQIDLYVLAGAQGASLAFGPGHLHGTALPGEGASAIAAHRDTHFRFLQYLGVGDQLRVQTAYGSWLDYRVVDTEVVNSDEQSFRVAIGTERLYLITCFPFNALNAGGPLRYVVKADLISRT